MEETLSSIPKGEPPVCNRDCFQCPFPDCVDDRITQEERRASMIRDSELKERSKVAAAKKAYYEANREKVAAAKKAYYEANREKVAAAQKAYREANREKVAAKNGRFLFDLRTEHGMSQSSLARVLGVSQSAVSRWESGELPFDLEKVKAFFEGRRGADGR